MGNKKDMALPKGAKLISPKRTYQIEKVLGAGGFGITYKVSANLLVDNVTVRTFFAVKEFFMSEACERDNTDSIVYSNPVKDKVEECRKDFYAEAQRLNKISLNHPNIIHVNEVFEANNTVYYVMEYLDAGSLRDYVSTHGALSENETLKIMLPILDAVSYLHENRMTHLDIKPDNIMLKHDPETGSIIPVLIDFGMSKHYDKKGKPTSTVRVSGFSEGYAPIEQYAGINTFSPQTDIYALTATIYFCIVGKDPVRSFNINEDIILASLPPGISKSFKEAIIKGMKVRSDERTQTVDELCLELSTSEEPYRTRTIDDINETSILDKDYVNRKEFFIHNKNKILIIAAAVAVAVIIAAFVLIKKDTGLSTFEKAKADAIERVESSNTLSSERKKIIENLINNMVFIKGGTFEMGATKEQGMYIDKDERPVHKVILSDYGLGRYEVRQSEWDAVMKDNSSNFDRDSIPVENVSWNDCKAFITKLKELTGLDFCFPSESEWEYAARGGNESKGYMYAGSNNISEVAWVNTGDDNAHIHSVGMKKPNELGLYDMSGNVCEWCEDWYGKYVSIEETNPLGPTSGPGRVYRGGSYNDIEGGCRNSKRMYTTPDDRTTDAYESLSKIGLRLCIDITYYKD